MAKPARFCQPHPRNRLTSALDLLARRHLHTLYGEAEEFLFRYANAEVIVLAIGDWRGRRRVPVRVHSTCFSAHYLGSTECDCREQLVIAISAMADFGGGIVIFLDQDGRGNGHAGLMRSADYVQEHGGTVGQAYEALGYPKDARTYHAVPLVLRHLGVEEILLFTNNPDKLRVVLDAGIQVESRTVVAEPPEQGRLDTYYDNKRAEGHMIPNAVRP